MAIPTNGRQVGFVRDVGVIARCPVAKAARRALTSQAAKHETRTKTNCCFKLATEYEQFT